MKYESSSTVVAEANVKDELNDLHGGEVLFPPGLNSDGSHGVVPVHESVYDQVQGDWDPLLEESEEKEEKRLEKSDKIVR